ncbi:MAG: tetratricopeptide repeat protein [Acetobacteraceae bacterium]|nr:tetratricopeptide repeat protein [Acetobacteraceae bacterium]
MQTAAITDEPAVNKPAWFVTAAKAAYDRGDALAARRLLRPLVERGEAAPDVLSLFADASMSAGEIAGLADLLDRAITSLGESEARVVLRLKQAQALMAERRDREALAAAAEAAEGAPRDPETVEVFGHALLRNGRTDEALLMFREAIERSGRVTFRCAMGMLQALERGGNHEAAIEFGDAIKTQFPGQAMIDVALARIERRLGRFEDAEKRLLQLPLALRNTVEVLVALAETALLLHRDEEAKLWFEKAYRLNPDDPFLRHVTGTEQTARASDDYVRGLFDSYAGHFEQSLIGLGYRVPGLILRALERHEPDLSSGKPIADVLDLGCGTGLVGVVLHDRLGGRLKGVDLSPGMIARAREKGVYTELEVSELTHYLENETASWRTVIAADVFCYFGDLEPPIRRIREILEPNGLFIFSVERLSAPDGWVKQATGRYAHSVSYITKGTG